MLIALYSILMLPQKQLPEGILWRFCDSSMSEESLESDYERV